MPRVNPRAMQGPCLAGDSVCTGLIKALIQVASPKICKILRGRRMAHNAMRLCKVLHSVTEASLGPAEAFPSKRKEGYFSRWEDGETEQTIKMRRRCW